MDKDNKANPSRFPQEMPADNKKDYSHGVIENVVKNEIEAPLAKNPVKPADTDSLNTEFAKKQWGTNQ